MDGERSAFGARLDAVLTGPFAGFTGLLTDRCDPFVATRPEMARSVTLADARHRLAEHHPGAEPGVVASLWSRHCFSVLLVPGLDSAVEPPHGATGLSRRLLWENAGGHRF